jgi:protein TonB
VIARGAFVMVALAGAGWSASVAFPVVVAAAVVDPTAVPRDVALPAEHRREAAPSAAPAIAVTPQVPRGGGAPRPGPAIVPKPQSAGTAVKPITPENPIPRRLSSVAVPYPASLRGTGARARLGLRVIVDASGSVLDVQNTLFASATTRADAAEERQRMEAFIAEASAAIRQWRYAPPADPPIAFFVAVMFEPDRDGIVAQSDSPLAQASIDIQRGFNDGVLGGLQQRLATLRQTREQLLQRYGANAQLVIAMGSQIADLEAQAERLKQSGAVTAQAGPAAPARPPLVSPSGKPPIRVGGSIAVPQKAKDVRPVYPELAKSVRVQGVVILEAIIDEQGRVADARILRSIPLLDQAALDAVKQWEFTPTLLNGEPVPIIMTMTIQFSLPEPQ